MPEKELLNAENVGEELKNVQLSPTDVRVEINDKIVKVLFRKAHEVNGNFGVLAKKSAKKSKSKKSKVNQSGDVLIEYTVSTNSGDATVILDEFDRAVLGVCISEQKAGNLYTTVNAIFRALIGEVGNVGVRPMNNQSSAIRNSIKKLMGTIVNFQNLGKSLAELGYIDDASQFKIKASSLLPAILLDCRINGQVVKDVLYFDRESPLLKLAEKKNQIVRYPVELLDVPNQNNTPLIISLKTYVMRRVAEIKAHKMTPTITFEDVFAKCGIDGASRDQKFNCRKEVLKLFEHLQNKNFITSYEPAKRGVNVYAIKFTYNSKG